MLPVLVQEPNMAPSRDKIVITNEEENLLKALKMTTGLVLTMVLKAAIELGLFEIIEKSSQISSYEIASHLPTKNPKAPLILERILMFLASESLLTCNIIKDVNGCDKRLYSLTPLSMHYLVSTKQEESLAPLLLLVTDQTFVNSWCHLKDAILEGEAPFKKAHGMHMFEYLEKDSRYDKVFNKAMQHVTCLSMQKILESYDGLQGVKQVVDVGGGLGVSLASIVNKYPHIKGVNFDQPHVIKDAPTYAGVEHVGGDMFESVPKGEVILVKWILHNWDDDNCLKILKNCWSALPEDGKVVVIEVIKEEYPADNLISKHAFTTDIIMMNFLPGGKERTKQEYEALAKEAGFASMKIVSRACCDWVIELYKH